ncbi:MAG: GntR family transcriptional regulator [Chloroflexi bacterium]|nr:GntR family transcriptional regulator [Chloroflexota bacterium]
MATNTSTTALPQYVRIRESLRERIDQGEFRRGEKLPSEEELSTFYGVSRMTLRQSMSDLVDEGLLYRKHGIGTFVALQHFARDHSHLQNFFETSRLNGLSVDEKILEMDVIPARFQVAKALGLDEGEQVIHLKTLRIVEGNPVTIHEAYFSHEKFSNFTESNVDTLSKDLLAYYQSCGFKVRRGVQRIDARSAEPEVAQLLEIDECAPVRYKERTLYTEEGIPVEFLNCYNRGDLYSVTFNLSAE